MTSLHSDVSLATLTTENYLPGTVAMLGSFLKHHPGFGGDIVIIEHGLPEKWRRMLQAAFARVRFVSVAAELQERVERLQAELPHLKIFPANFSKLDIFRLSGYRKVLLCDSDLLFRAPVSELFEADDALICCGDRILARGQHRDAETMAPLHPAASGGSGGEALRPILEQPFNSGFLVIDGDESCMGEHVYADLLAILAAEHWRRFSLKVPLTDQPVLNRYFAGRQTLVSWTYNYLVPHAADIQAREGLDASEAKVLHYLGSLKPWSLRAVFPRTTGGVGSSMTNAFNLWYEAYMDCPASTRWPPNVTALVRTCIRRYLR